MEPSAEFSSQNVTESNFSLISESEETVNGEPLQDNSGLDNI